MQCWKCRTELPDYPGKKLPFRDICNKCLAWQHCCKNCRNYKPGMPNDCLIPGTEFISDREAFNFCEEFQIGGSSNASFKIEDSKTKFNDLFKD